jgi:hypothetical protein
VTANPIHRIETLFDFALDPQLCRAHDGAGAGAVDAGPQDGLCRMGGGPYLEARGRGRLVGQG